jgi:hypothetical protein
MSGMTEINPMGTDGFEFVEYMAADPAHLEALFILTCSPIRALSAPTLFSIRQC